MHRTSATSYYDFVNKKTHIQNFVSTELSVKSAGWGEVSTKLQAAVLTSLP